MVPITVRATTDPLELERIDGLRAALSPRKAQRTLMILNGSVGVLYVGLGSYRVLSAGGRGASLGYYWLALGLLYFFMVAVFYRFNRISTPKAGATRDAEVTISDTGLRFVPSGQALPWKKILEVRKLGDSVAFVAPNGASIAAVSQGDLVNDGRDLWRALDDLLISKRYLIRATLSSERIPVGPHVPARS